MEIMKIIQAARTIGVRCRDLWWLGPSHFHYNILPKTLRLAPRNFNDEIATTIILWMGHGDDDGMTATLLADVEKSPWHTNGGVGDRKGRFRWRIRGWFRNYPQSLEVIIFESFLWRNKKELGTCRYSFSCKTSRIALIFCSLACLQISTMSCG